METLETIKLIKAALSDPRPENEAWVICATPLWEPVYTQVHQEYPKADPWVIRVLAQNRINDELRALIAPVVVFGELVPQAELDLCL